MTEREAYDRMLDMLRCSGVNLLTAAHTIERLGDKPNADATRRMAEQILPVIRDAEQATGR